MNNMLKRFLIRWRSVRYRRYYVIADCSDNSITLSNRLYRHIDRMRLRQAQDVAKVFVFHVPAWNTYGFAVNPDLDKATQLADIQYNDKYRSIGFESLCPTVNRILHDYGLPFGPKMRLTVSVRRLPDGKIFYNIERPRNDNT